MKTHNKSTQINHIKRILQILALKLQTNTRQLSTQQYRQSKQHILPDACKNCGPQRITPTFDTNLQKLDPVPDCCKIQEPCKNVVKIVMGWQSITWCIFVHLWKRRQNLSKPTDINMSVGFCKKVCYMSFGRRVPHTQLILLCFKPDLYMICSRCLS